MRKFFIGSITLAILSMTVFIAAQPQKDHVKVSVTLRDEAGESVAGIIQVLGADGKSLEIPGLFARTTGLTKDMPGIHWYVVPKGGAEATLPRARLKLHAVSGLETALAQKELDLTGKTPASVAIDLAFLFRPEKSNLVAGNTHLHLRGFSLETADEYIRKIPAADGLRVLFISYLERDKDDLSYITNKYPIGDLPKLSVAGVLVNNGEEHRHNFLGYGQGYGHVMFLNIKQLVKPVSIGPGIAGGGFDDPALRPGIDDAKKQGGTVIWCHNTNGFEDVPSAVTGRLDALNVFDGSRGGLYEDNYYRYLNIGLKMPISTGTDWFMYDFSRVYAEVLPSLAGRASDGPNDPSLARPTNDKLTIASWLDAVKAGRCQATNGPLLSLTVNGKKMGDVIDLKDVTTLKIEASAIGRHPSQKLQLIHNGKVIKTQLQRLEGHKVKLTHEVRIDAPAWFAVRIDSEAKDEFNKKPFAHSSPVYVNFDGKGVFDVDAAQGLLKQVEEGHATISAKAKFSSPEAGKKLLAIYDQAGQILRERINARK